jgi:hypothetical protein
MFQMRHKDWARTLEKALEFSVLSVWDQGVVEHTHDRFMVAYLVIDVSLIKLSARQSR